MLYAEDEPSIANPLKLYLMDAGHFVECAPDGQAALERIMSDLTFYDLLITDHNMPRTTGLELVRSLRAAGYTGCVIVHSSALKEKEAKAYCALQVTHFFEKPLQTGLLIKLVARLAWDLPSRMECIVAACVRHARFRPPLFARPCPEATRRAVRKGPGVSSPVWLPRRYLRARRHRGCGHRQFHVCRGREGPDQLAGSGAVNCSNLTIAAGSGPQPPAKAPTK